MATAQLLRDELENGKHHVVYTITDAQNKVHGPFVTTRDEDALGYVNAQAAAWVEPVDYYALLEGALGSEAYNKLREELKNIGATKVRIGDVVMNVTWPVPTNLEDTRAELESRVDAGLGDGTLNTIAATIAAGLGVTSVTIERESVVPLI